MLPYAPDKELFPLKGSLVKLQNMKCFSFIANQWNKTIGTQVNLFATATLSIEIMNTATILTGYRFDPLLLTYKMEGSLTSIAHSSELGSDESVFCPRTNWKSPSIALNQASPLLPSFYI